MATFITSKLIGQTITISVNTSTNKWKYNHNGADSSVFNSGSQTITVANANGEFTIISCLADGTVSGDIINLNLNNNQITSFDGIGLSALTDLSLVSNQLTSFDGTGMSSLVTLYLDNNSISSFNKTDLTNVQYLGLANNQLTSFDGSGMALFDVQLNNNLLTSLSFSGCSGLYLANISNNNLTSIDMTGVGGNLTDLNYSNNNAIPAVVNDQLLIDLDSNGMQFCVIDNSATPTMERTAASTSAFNSLSTFNTFVSSYNVVVPAPTEPVTFITSKSVGQTITISSIDTTTGYWKYYHNDVYSTVYPSSTSNLEVTVDNANGEFTLLPCTSGGTISGDLTFIFLGSYDGSITNEITSFDTTGLSSLQYLYLNYNLITSIDVTPLASLIDLSIAYNLLTSLNVDNSPLFNLYVQNNQLTSLSIANVDNFGLLAISNNPLPASVNDQILSQIVANSTQTGNLVIDPTYFGGTGSNQVRTNASDADLTTITTTLGWSLTGTYDITTPAPTEPVTFITSAATSSTISINVSTSTGYWKYYHNSTYSSVYSNGQQGPTVENANGEFTILPCLSDGTVSGDIIDLDLNSNQITSFDGTGLSGLTGLYLAANQLTSFDGTGLSSLTTLNLSNNPLTGFTGGDMGNISYLSFSEWNITTLETFDGAGLSSLTSLNLDNNQLTSFIGTGLSSLTSLSLYNNLLTSFNGNGLSGLTSLSLYNNLLTSFDGTGLSGLTNLYLSDNQLTSVNLSGLTSLGYLSIGNNPIPTLVNDQILADLVANGVYYGYLHMYGTPNQQRTSASNANFNTLDNTLNWTIAGTYDIVAPTLPPTFITSATTGASISVYVQTTEGYWKYAHNGVYSSVYGNGYQYPMVQNSNGEFVIQSCDASGNVTGDVTYLSLSNNQITSFDGTGLSGLTNLILQGNQLTSFDGTDLSGLTYLNLRANQLSSFDGVGMYSLTGLDLGINQITSVNLSGVTNLNQLQIGDNPIPAFVNDQILTHLVSSNITSGSVDITGPSNQKRTPASNADFNTLDVTRNWTFYGFYDVVYPTFTTSKSVGQTVDVNVQTSTGYWKYNHNGVDSSVFSDGAETVIVTNANGQFKIIPCDNSGNESGDITYLDLFNNQITSFYGTGLSSLTYLELGNNQLTSFDGTGLSSLVTLNLGNNQITSFNGTPLISLVNLELSNNLLTYVNLNGLTSLSVLTIGDNPIPALVNNQILADLVESGFNGGTLNISGTVNLERTAGSDTNYNDLTTTLSWTVNGTYDIVLPPPTFVTSATTGTSITISVVTTEGYWKYYHNDTYSSVYGNGSPQSVLVENSNGEFTILSCDASGDLNGDITQLYLHESQITSFNEAGLTSLTSLSLYNNQLTTFNGTGLSNLTSLSLYNNQLTTFNGTGLSSLTSLNLQGNPLTGFTGGDMGQITSLNFQSWGITTLESFDGNGLYSLASLNLYDNQLTSFDGTGLSSLTSLSLFNNPLTGFTGGDMGQITGLDFQWAWNITTLETFDGGNMTGLTSLNLANNPLTTFNGGNMGQITNLNFVGGISTLTSFDGGNMTGLTNLNIGGNQLTSFNGSGLSSLTNLDLMTNQLTSFDGTGLSGVTTLVLANNQLTSVNLSGLTSLNSLNIGNNPIPPLVNDQILNDLVGNNVYYGYLSIFGGPGNPDLVRTFNSNSDYNTLDNTLNWTIFGTYDIAAPTLPPTFITSATTGTSISVYVTTTEGYWKYIHNGVYSSVYGNGSQSVLVENSNGEFVIQSCDNTGNVTGDITYLSLSNNQITSFDGTGLSGLTQLYLNNNSLTSFDGTDLSSLTFLTLANNPLTGFTGGDMGQITGLDFPNTWGITTLESFDGSGLSGLIYLNLQNNQLTSFDGFGLFSLITLIVDNNPLTGFTGGDMGLITNVNLGTINGITGLTSFNGVGLSGVTTMVLANNQLTSVNVSGMTSLNNLIIGNNPIPTLVNDQILADLVANGVYYGYLSIFGGFGNPDLVRTSASDSDYNTLDNTLNWTIFGTYDIVAPTLPPTFITSATTGTSISVYVQTTEGYWKYVHNGVYSSVYGNGSPQGALVENSNGEFVIQSCDASGNVTGDVTYLGLSSNQITSFDGTGLSGLTYLDLGYNQITSFSGTGLSSLIVLNLTNNPLTTFNGGNMGQITSLPFNKPIGGWNITTLQSFDGGNMIGLTEVFLSSNQLTSFVGTGLSNLTNLEIFDNQLTSFDGAGLSSLFSLNMFDNQLTSVNLSGLTSLGYLSIGNNPIPALVNDQILADLVANNYSGGMLDINMSLVFPHPNLVRTSASNGDFNTVDNTLNWNIIGTYDIYTPPTPGNGKLRVKGVTQI